MGVSIGHVEPALPRPTIVTVRPSGGVHPPSGGSVASRTDGLPVIAGTSILVADPSHHALTEQLQSWGGKICRWGINGFNNNRGICGGISTNSQNAIYLYSMIYDGHWGVPPATPMARLAHREVPLDGYPVPAWASGVAVPSINQGRDSGTTLTRSALELARVSHQSSQGSGERGHGGL